MWRRAASDPDCLPTSSEAHESMMGIIPSYQASCQECTLVIMSGSKTASTRKAHQNSRCFLFKASLETKVLEADVEHIYGPEASRDQARSQEFELCSEHPPVGQRIERFDMRDKG